MAGNLFVVSGPAGAGKGTLVAAMRDVLDDVWVSISATTRAPRGEEQDGVEYFFLSQDEFKRMIDEDGFIEYAYVHGNYYGTPVAPIKEHLDAGAIVILEIDVQGGLQVRDKFPDAHLVFIEPPSMEVLEQRLRGRGTDSEEQIELRLENAKAELAVAADYDCSVVNDDLDESTKRLAEVIQLFASH